MRIFSISCIFIFLTFQSSAQPLPSEPRYRLAYLESLLEEVQDLPEEERFLYLSYTSMVRNDYRRVVEDMIVTKGVLERMKTEGITQTNKAYQRRVEKLKHYKQSLRKKTTRLLSYQELEIKISRQAIEEMVSNPVEKSIQRDYYEALTFWIRFKELKKMPEEELFLYLRDNSGVDRSYHLLIEDREKYKKDLDELQALGVDEKDERYQLAKEGFERVTAAIRLEAERVMKGYAFHAMILDRSWRKAAEQLKEQDKETASGI